MRCAAVLALCWAVTPSRGNAAQVEASVAAGVGSVRTSDGGSSTAISVAPAFRVFGSTSVLDGQGILSALPHGDWNVQLLLDAWWQPVGGSRGPGLAVAAALKGSALPDDARAAATELLAELIHQGRGRGIGLGAGPRLGMVAGNAPMEALRVRARSWLQTVRWRCAIVVEPTRLNDVWYTDAQASVGWQSGPAALTLLTTGRFPAGGDADATASAVAAWMVAPRVTLEAAYGGFLADPFLGFESATSGSIGVRLGLGGRAAPSAGPVVAQRRGQQAVLRLRVRGATSVAIAGDWTEWSPVPLRRLKPNGDVWEGSFALLPGTYRFNLLVDGAAWTLPEGVASVPDGLGGRVGLLVVPAASQP